MKKLVFAATFAVLGSVMAQQTASVPEETSQAKCAIEEKDVDVMMDEYIASKGWTEGLNTKSDGSKFFVAKGSAVIQAPRDDQKYISSRVNAFNKAMLDAKKAMVEYLGVEIATETKKAYAEGRAVNPKLTEKEVVDEKLKQLLYAKLNKKLAEEGIDPIEDPEAAKKALGKQLNSEQYKKIIVTMARAKILGFQACCTFEGASSDGKGEIGVVAIWSPKLQAMAASIVTGAPVPAVGAKRPVRDQISSDPATLISTFGVQQKIDEAGDLVLVAFGQAGGVSESKAAGKGAQNRARANAMAAIREFAGEQMVVATGILDAESAEEFESGAEIYENESEMKEKIEAAASRMNIAGIAPLKSFKFKHPINGKIVYGSIVTWKPKQAGQARTLKRTMANPAATSGLLRANPARGDAAHASDRSYNAAGQGADDDAF